VLFDFVFCYWRVNDKFTVFLIFNKGLHLIKIVLDIIYIINVGDFLCISMFCARTLYIEITFIFLNEHAIKQSKRKLRRFAVLPVLGIKNYLPVVAGAFPSRVPFILFTITSKVCANEVSASRVII